MNLLEHKQKESYGSKQGLVNLLVVVFLFLAISIALFSSCNYNLEYHSHLQCTPINIVPGTKYMFGNEVVSFPGMFQLRSQTLDEIAKMDTQCEDTPEGVVYTFQHEGIARYSYTVYASNSYVVDICLRTYKQQTHVYLTSEVDKLRMDNITGGCANRDLTQCFNNIGNRSPNIGTTCKSCYASEAWRDIKFSIFMQLFTNTFSIFGTFRLAMEVVFDRLFIKHVNKTEQGEKYEV